MLTLHKRKHTFLKGIYYAFIFFLASGFSYFAFAAPPTSPYAPGATLDPSCAPGSANCTVSTAAGSSGEVQFVNASSTLASDVNFFWDNINKRLGIGTTTPSAALSVVGQIVGGYFTGTSIATSTFGGNLAISGTGTTTSSGGFDISAGCYAISGICVGGATSAAGGTGAVQFANGTAFTGDTTNFFWDNTNKRLGIGATAPAYALDVTGAIRARDVIAGSMVFTSTSSAYSTLTSFGGFNGYINASGGFGTGGSDSILNAPRITSAGNLVNIGSIQGGELNLTKGGTFATKVDYTTGTSPENVAIGDLNGDGKADLITANNGAVFASVFINNGNGTFATKVDYTTGTSPYDVKIGDLNGDGKADFIVTNYGSNTISVFLNNSNGTFAAKVDYTTGTQPDAVALGDFNGDGKTDIAVSNNNAATVSVFLNNGDGTFAAKVDYTAGSFNRDIAVADLNGDGKTDIVTANSGATTASVFLNNSNGTFAAKVDYTTGSSPDGIAIGDLNGDGKADFVTTNGGATTASVFLNNGNGTFATKVDYTTVANPYAVAVGDLNGDGKTDFAVANETGTVVSVFLNNSNGTFAAKVDYTTGSLSHSVVIGDLNGDGKADLAVANNVSNTVSILLNNATSILFAQASTGKVGIGTSTPAYALHVATTTTGAIVARFQNGTGYCDINPTTTALVCTSDATLKKDVVTIGKALDSIVALRGVKFKWLSEDEKTPSHVGVIAQEVEKVLPELVATDDVSGKKSVNYIGFISVLIEAVKELAFKVAVLESRISQGATSGISSIKDFVFDTLTARKVVTDVLQMKDSATNDIYCVKITNGEWDKTKGVCVESPASTQLADVVKADAPASELATSTPSADTTASSTLNIVNVTTDTTIAELVTATLSAGVMTSSTVDTMNATANTAAVATINEAL